MKERDITRLGLTIVGNEAVPTPDDPDDTWDIERLSAYAVGEMAMADEDEAQSIVFARRSAVHLYRAGHAFLLIRSKLKKNSAWMAWLKAKSLPHSTVTQAIQLYERAGSEDAVANLTITEAKEKAAIVKTKTTDENSNRSANRTKTRGRRRGTTSRERHDDSGDLDVPLNDSPEDDDPAPNEEDTGIPTDRRPANDRTREQNDGTDPRFSEVPPGSDHWQNERLQTWRWGDWRIVDNPTLACPAHFELWHGRALIGQAPSVEEAQQKANHWQHAIENGKPDCWHFKDNPLGKQYTKRADGKEVPYNGACQFFHDCRDFAWLGHGHLEFFDAHNMQVILMGGRFSIREQLAALFEKGGRDDGYDGGDAAVPADEESWA